MTPPERTSISQVEQNSHMKETPPSLPIYDAHRPSSENWPPPHDNNATPANQTPKEAAQRAAQTPASSFAQTKIPSHYLIAPCSGENHARPSDTQHRHLLLLLSSA